MKITWRGILWATGLMMAAATPLILRAQGISVNVTLTQDNEAHFNFEDHLRHNRRLYLAAKELAEGKTFLWALNGDFGGHREKAIQSLNNTLDEIRLADDYVKNR